MLKPHSCIIQVREAVARAGLEPACVEHVVFGNVLQTEPRDAYLARVGAVEAGVPTSAPALTLNRLCGSGLQAVVSAAQMIRLGDAEVAVAGGAESMSRAGHLLPALRWGARMGEVGVVDTLVGVLTDPFGHGHMGETAENVAERVQVTREEQDAFACESHRRAVEATRAGRFAGQIVPVEVAGKRGASIRVEADEHPRQNVTLENLAALRPAFRKGGTVTAGNASGVNDGAAALVMMDAARAAREGVVPMARLVSYAHSAVDPEIMGLGPVPAVRRALERAGLALDDMDVIESNEAFAAQACAVSRTLGMRAERTNPNGGAVALGHPIGATGAILMVKLLHELRRVDGRYGLVTLCIGGGQGIAVVVEAPGS